MNLSFELKKLFGRGNLSNAVRQEFDLRRGYAHHHAQCRAARARQLPVEIDSEWMARGYARKRVLPPDECERLRTRIEASSSTLQRNSPTDIRSIDDRTLLREVLERILTPQIDRRLLQLFESEYVPYWCVYDWTLPNACARRSLLWHCDKGPTASAKMLVNLTSASQTGGSTDVLDRPTTQRFDRAGYVFRSQSARQEDLSQFARSRDIPYEPRAIALEAGESLLFLPQQLLHRGMPPGRSARCMLSVAFLPSPAPWREAFQRLEANPPPEVGALAWARDAETLTRRMKHGSDA